MTSATAPATAQQTPIDFLKVACSLPHEQLLRIWRGTQLDRSGDVIIVPQEPNFVGTNFPHSGPWAYLQDVPMLWYGPGYVPARGVVDRPTTLADIAPTQAALLHYDGFTAPDGRVLSDVLPPATKGPPPLIVTFVWDASGRSVLDTYPNDWPVLKSLIPKGVWYEHATVGSSPSITPASHATIGTGAFPMRTGQVDAEFRVGPDLIRSGELGPQLLDTPTLADLYDRAMGNAPIVGDLASVTWHLNMMGHGALFSGGDKDIAVLRTSTTGTNEGLEGNTWNLQGKNAPWYRVPPYVNDTPPLSAYTRALDQADGKLDGNWRSNDIRQLEDGWATPARVPYQDRMYQAVIKREGFGKDAVPDLLFINSKIIDHVSHLFSVNSPEMQDTLRWQDAGLRDFIHTLNTVVGKDRWVLVLTADHGAQFNPAVSGAFQVTPPALQADIEAAFDHSPDDGKPTVQAVRTSQIFLHTDELQRNGYSVGEVAQFVLDYTEGQASSNPAGLADPSTKVFAAAFPTSIFAHLLPCLPEMRG